MIVFREKYMNQFKRIKVISFLLFSFWLTPLLAQLMPDDVPYYVFEKNNYKFIFPEEDRVFMPQVTFAQEKIQKLYEKSFSWKLDELTSLALASNNNQVANAYATVFPNNLNFYYNGGASLYDSFAIRSWLFTLQSHEGAHLYQINPKRGLSAFYHDYLGNSLSPHLLSVVPIFVTPNMLLPTWILEGNAVLNESRLGNGGRLYSGEERALFYTMIRSGLLDEARLTNNHLDFPFTHEKYNIGAQFSLYLAETFGVDKVNRFFYAHAEHYINPFLLNFSFEDHFGISYSNAIKQFLIHSEKKARLQKISYAPRLIETPYLGPMNADDDKIFFISSDGKNKNKLNIYNKKTFQLKQQSLDLPSGKVFELKPGHFFSMSSGVVNQRQTLFSLWNDTGIDLENYRGKILLDKQGHNQLWFDPLLSLDEPQLFLNDEKYDVAHSSALFDREEHVFYFKQDKNERVLYKDKIEICRFPSYYGKLVDIDESGKPYFIASTEYGSSLFTYDQGKFFRLLDSDSVMDARKVRDGDFLVSEIGPEGYQLKNLRLSVREEKPVLYHYFFENEEAIHQFDQYKELGMSQTATLPLFREYSSLKDLRFSGLNTTLMYSNSSLLASVSGLFSDPLNWNNYILNYLRDEFKGKDTYNFTYLNKKHLLQWFINYSREEFYRGKNEIRNDRNYHNDRPEGGIRFPFFKYGLWSAKIEEAISFRTKRSAFVNYSAFSFEREKNHALEFYPYRKIGFMLEDDRGSDDEKTSAVSSELYHVLPFNLFVHAFGVYKESTETELAMEGRIRENSSPILTHGYSLLGYNKHLLRGGRVSFELGQFFESGIYFASFPLSLRRVAPKFIFNHYYYHQGKYKDFQERGVGLDAELLLAHLWPFRMTIATLRREKDAAQFMMSIGSQASF